MGNNEDKRAKRHKRHKSHRRPTPHISTPANRPRDSPSQLPTKKRAKPIPEEEDDDNSEIDTEIHDPDEIDVVGADDELNSRANTETPEQLNRDSPKLSTKPSTRKTMARKATTTSTTTKSTSPAVVQKNSPPTSTTPTNTSASSCLTPQNPGSANKRKRRRESGTSSDEERWLTAIESGKLDDVDDELKKMKDPKLMTARQRAMYERNLDKEPSPGGELLMSLPTGYREKEKPQTAEDIQKAALKSQKRKQMADEKREKDKKKTMERLLKKQESKQRSAARNKSAKTTQPMIVYRNTKEGAVIQMPVDHEYPLQPQTARAPPQPQLCGISGCGRPKVYNCSKTKIPLCSLECYRKNVQSVKQIIC